MAHAGWDPGAALAVFVTVPFWYVGFDTIPQAAEERREGSPLRRLGTYVVLAIIGSTIFYIAIILGAGMAGPWQGIVGEALPTAAAFSSAFDSEGLVRLVLVAGLIGLLTSWNGFFLAGSRVLFSLGRGHIIHASFGETHPRWGTPARAVVFSGIVTFVAALLGRGAILAFVDVGSFCIALAFFGVAVSLIRLREAFPDLVRPYRMPGGNALAYVAGTGSLFILAVMVWPGSPSRLVWPLEWVILGALTGTGVAFWLAAHGYRSAVSEADRAKLIVDFMVRADAAVDLVRRNLSGDAQDFSDFIQPLVQRWEEFTGRMVLDWLPQWDRPRRSCSQPSFSEGPWAATKSKRNRTSSPRSSITTSTTGTSASTT